MRHPLGFAVVQIAFSLMRVVCAGLFVRALGRAGAIDPGFDPRGVELASLDLSMARHSGPAAIQFWRDLRDRVRQLPGVQSATIAAIVPGGFEGLALGLSLPGAPPPWDEFDPDGNIVERGYFATLKIPIVAGRDFTDADRAGTTPVVIVGETTARYFWPGESAIGKFLSQPIRRADGTQASRTLTVVGVAGEVKSSTLVDGMAQSFVYLPLQQQEFGRATSPMMIVARAARGQRIGDELRTVVASMDANLPIVASRTLEESVAFGMTAQRSAAAISGSLGLIGTLLAAIGIYGVTAFAAMRRTREFGIRIALGAHRTDVVRMVLRQGLTLTAIGCAIGMVLGAGLGVVLGGFLFGLPPLDPMTFGGAAALFAAAGLAACYGPARRATRIDPLTALRRE